MSKMCKNCGTLSDDTASNCPNCGSALEASQPNPQMNQSMGQQPMGQPVQNMGQQPMPGYGQPMGQQPMPGSVPPGVEQKSKIVAGLLGIFLGGWGIHNFYLGNTSRAVIQIVVTLVTCGIGSVWGLIEGIMILCGSIKTDANGVPLKD